MKTKRVPIRGLICFVALWVPASGAVIYVDGRAAGRNSGASWTDACISVSAAINRASAGDEVWVAEGTYEPITLKSGVKVYAGFAGTETEASQGAPNRNKTYISGNGRSRAIEGKDISSSTVVRGFYIVNGFIDIPDTGAGMYLEDCDTVFVDCVFTSNRAVTLGGAGAIWGGSPTFVNCRFQENDGGWGAGALFIRRSATPSFVNCLFDRNSAREAGAIFVDDGSPKFTNCTLAENRCTIGKGGAMYDGPGEAELRNCILWNNLSAVDGTNEIYNHPAAGRASTATRCNIKGGWAGTGNMDADPQFVAPERGDYRLQRGSPCRNAGDNAALPADALDLNRDGSTQERMPRDLDQSPRIEGSGVDLGAFEVQSEE